MAQSLIVDCYGNHVDITVPQYNLAEFYNHYLTMVVNCPMPRPGEPADLHYPVKIPEYY